MENSGSGAKSSRTWLIPIACLLSAGALLGLSTNLAKLAAEAELAPLPFLTWSVAGAAAILVAINATRGHLPTINTRKVEYYFAAGLVSIAAPRLIFFAAVPHVGVSFVALSIAFPPLLTYAGALVLGMERFSSRRALGVVLALAGASWLAALKLSAPDAPTIWIVATLFGPILLAIGNIYRAIRWPKGARPDELAPGMLGASALMLILVGAVPGQSLAVSLDTTVPLLLILLQAAAFALQYLLFFILLKRGGPVYYSLLGSVGAVFGVPIAILLLGEAPPPGLDVGATLIAFGIYFVSRGGARPSS